MKFTKIFFLPVVFLTATGIFSCKKKSTTDYVPYVPVNINIYTTDPSFFNLQVVGGWENITGGSRGILIYRKTQDLFMAYDRHCPYQPSNACGQVSVNTTNVSAVDSCCGSQFSIIDGSIQKGPAAMPLKQYVTTFNGTVLHISN